MSDIQEVLRKVEKEIDKKFGSISALASKLGLVRQTLGFQLKGKSKMPLSVFIDICNALGVNPSYFFLNKSERENISDYTVKEPNAKYYKKSELSNDDIMKLQQENMNLKHKMQSAYQEMNRLQEANLKLIDLLSKSN